MAGMERGWMTKHIVELMYRAALVTVSHDAKEGEAKNWNEGNLLGPV